MTPILKRFLLNMKRFSISLLFLTVSIFFSCKSNEYDRRADAFFQRNALEEAQADYDDKDYKILGVLGVGLHYPGLDQDLAHKIVQDHGNRIIEGTSDVVENESHSRYMKAANDFAATYNKRKVELIEQNIQRDVRQSAAAE